MNTHHKHRVLLAAVKVGTFVAWWAGVPDLLIAAVVTPWACWWAFRILRDGIREQIWVDPKAQARWHWEDLVWDHTVWVNKGETPEQGIERLTAHLRPDPTRDRTGAARPPVATFTAINEPKPLRAPHEMAIP